jgi:hypothetical protein
LRIWPDLPKNLTVVWEEVDRVLPFVIENLEEFPLGPLFTYASTRFILKMAEFEPATGKTVMHHAITDYVHLHKEDFEFAPEYQRVHLVRWLKRRQSPPPDDPVPVSRESTFTIPLPTVGEVLTNQLGIVKKCMRKLHSRKLLAKRNLKLTDELTPAVIKSAERFAFVLLIHGEQFAAVEQICAYLNIEVPNKGAFYGAQPGICDKLIAKARDSCSRWKDSMKNEAAISFDGSWSHRRSAMHCFGASLIPINTRSLTSQRLSIAKDIPRRFWLRAHRNTEQNGRSMDRKRQRPLLLP